MNEINMMAALFEQAVITDDKSGITYVEPNYRFMIQRLIEEHPDWKQYADVMAEMCVMEAKKRNAKANKINSILEWVDAIISDTAEPALTDTQNNLIADLVDYLKNKDQLAEREQDLQAREADANMKNILPLGLNMKRRDK